MLDWFGLQPEYLLFPVGFGLYLFDLSNLLYIDEALFCRSPRGVWTFRLPNGLPELGRRYLAMAQPFRPGTVVLRSSWPAKRQKEERPVTEAVLFPRYPLERLRFVGVLCTGLLPQIFILMPMTYFMVGPVSFLICVFLVYLQILAMVVWIAFNRRRLQLPISVLAMVAFEAIVCIPFAINSYRKLSAKLYEERIDPLLIADGLLSEEDQAKFRLELSTILDRQLRVTEPGTSRHGALSGYLLRIGEAVKT